MQPPLPKGNAREEFLMTLEKLCKNSSAHIMLAFGVWLALLSAWVPNEDKMCCSVTCTNSRWTQLLYIHGGGREGPHALGGEKLGSNRGDRRG